jgi:Ca-activated chloride channel homolog
MMKLLYLLTFLLMGFGGSPRTQEKIITGTVTAAADHQPLPGVMVVVKGTTTGTSTDGRGRYTLTVPPEQDVLVFSFIGYSPQEIKIGSRSVIDVKLKADVRALEEVVVTGYGIQRGVAGKVAGVVVRGTNSLRHQEGPTAAPASAPNQAVYDVAPQHNTEEYARIQDHAFLDASKNPLSTFSIDVDNASYSNLRRFLHQGQLPYKDAVRTEEMLNYFTYDYPQPAAEHPVSISTELAACPWNPEHRLLHIGLQGRRVPTENLPPSNLVLLIDVSGSMNTPEKLPLVKAGFKLLVEQLRPQDRVAIVVYAGAAGLVLPSTPGSRKDLILDAIENLEAGGSTAGGAGIRLAYKVAQEHFMPEGNNRVILASDGDFNVGVSSTSELERLIEQKRETGVFLTVLGFGYGNLKDARMEKLADKGNGNYAYVDNLLEAKKVFVTEFGGTLFTIAQDVKLQLEFNPARVKAYRLIGYENRALQAEDFNNDRKDAGDMGSGHSVTALYEIVPVIGLSPTTLPSVDPLRYQQVQLAPKATATDELLTLKLRYKAPRGSKSKLLQTTVADQAVAPAETSDNFRFSAAVAAFAMLLRESEFKGSATYAGVVELAEGSRGQDPEGYRTEFIKLVKTAELLSPKGKPVEAVREEK